MDDVYGILPKDTTKTPFDIREIIARLVERGVRMDSVLRHAVPDVPIPGAATLEQVVVPNEGSILRAIQSVKEKI